MNDYNNEQRTAKYLENFTREKVLSSLISKTNPTIFDIGANMGQSIQEFLDIWPDANVIAFEPQQECLEHLKQFENENVQVVGMAAGNVSNSNLSFYSHQINFGLTGYSSGLSGFNRLNVNAKDSLNLSKMQKGTKEYEEYVSQLNHETKVSCVRLDEWIENNSIAEVDLLKIDTQGFEPEVIEGMGEYLKTTKVVLTEVMLYDLYERSLSFSDIEKHLLPAGFKLFDISHISKNPLNGRTDWVDLIYVNENC